MLIALRRYKFSLSCPYTEASDRNCKILQDILILSLNLQFFKVQNSLFKKICWMMPNRLKFFGTLLIFMIGINLLLRNVCWQIVMHCTEHRSWLFLISYREERIQAFRTIVNVFLHCFVHIIYLFFFQQIEIVVLWCQYFDFLYFIIVFLQNLIYRR